MTLTDEQKLAMHDRLVEALHACHRYWAALAVQWHNNDGRLLESEKGAFLDGTARIEELCEDASMKVGTIATELGLEPVPTSPSA